MNAKLIPLHHFDLGPPMEPAEIELQLRRIKSSDGLRAILQHLRNKSVDVDVTGRQPPVLPGLDGGQFRAYHDGGADALEEVFREIHAFSEAEEPEDEEQDGS